MAPVTILFVLLFGLPLALISVLLVGYLREPVRHKRVVQFVERTGVHLTGSNVSLVLDGLARTVRWRVAGVVVATSFCLAGLMYSAELTRTASVGSGTVVVLACGFLAGAVIGEVGNAVRRGPGPRTASLDVRHEADYVGSWAQRVPLAIAVASVAAAAALWGLLGAPSGLDLLSGAIVPWLVARWATRTILERPRPQSDEADVLAADDGLRSRGLHAIGGPVVLVGSWSLASLLFALITATGDAKGSLLLVYVAALLAGARIAWLLAVRPFRVVPDQAAHPAPVRELS